MDSSLPPGFGVAAPSTVPLPQPSALSQIMAGADASTELVKGVLDHQLVLGSQATKAMLWLRAYCPDVALWVMEYRRYHQRPQGLVKALDAVAIKEFMEGVQVNLSNGSK